MPSIRNPGRIAGLWYLLLTLLGPVRLIYIPGKLLATDDPRTTVANIAANLTLFRLGIIADILCAVILIMLTLAFFRLFQGVDQHLAALVVILGGIMPATIYFFNVVNDAGTLAIARGANFLSAFDQPQRDAIAMLLLRLHNDTNTAASMLWGLWLLPLGLLVYRSRFMPRFIGVWLMINCAAYVIVCLVGWLAPQYQGRVFNIETPATLGEIVMMLWLVIKGAKPPQASASAQLAT